MVFAGAAVKGAFILPAALGHRRFGRNIDNRIFDPIQIIICAV